VEDIILFPSDSFMFSHSLGIIDYSWLVGSAEVVALVVMHRMLSSLARVRLILGTMVVEGRDAAGYVS
jgi:hypothetical protein